MPIYEYECRECGHVFDALQKMSDDPLSDCPDCGKPELRKLLSAPNFRLKGGGWYETDFKDKNKRNLADGGDSEKAKPKSDAAESKSTGSNKESAKATKAGGSASSSGKSD
jgi:putative FmdB family regulatory protein